MSNDVATTSPLHEDFRRIRWTKPTRQFAMLTVLLLIGAVMAAFRRNWSEAGFCLVMLIAASGPFLLIYRKQDLAMREFGLPASAVYASTTPAPVRIVLLQFMENQQRVNEVRITDDITHKFYLCRVMLAKGYAEPLLGQEFNAVARIGEKDEVAIVDCERYRMWCKIISSESLEVPSLPPLEP